MTQQKTGKKKSGVLPETRVRNKKRPIGTSFSISEQARELLGAMSSLENVSYSEFCAVGLEAYIDAKLEQQYQMSREEFLEYWESKTSPVIKIRLPQTQVAA